MRVPGKGQRLRFQLCRYNGPMPILSPHERASVRNRIATLELRLRELHSTQQLTAREKFHRWVLLYRELKRLRNVSARVDLIAGGRSPVRRVPLTA
jgi:hypothetical protein